MLAGPAPGRCGIPAWESKRWQWGVEVVTRQLREVNAQLVLLPEWVTRCPDHCTFPLTPQCTLHECVMLRDIRTCFLCALAKWKTLLSIYRADSSFRSGE